MNSLEHLDEASEKDFAEKESPINCRRELKTFSKNNQN